MKIYNQIKRSLINNNFFLLSLGDIFTKIPQETHSSIIDSIVKESAEFVINKKIAFNQFYLYEYQYNRIIKLYKEIKYIGIIRYYISYILKSSIYEIYFYINFIFIRRHSVKLLSGTNFIEKFLIYSVAYHDLVPAIEKVEYENISLELFEIKTSIEDLIKVFIIKYKYHINDFKTILEYVKITQQLEKIDFNNKIILVEEAQNLQQQFFLDFAKEKKLNILITARGIYSFSRYLFGFEVVTDNKISKDLFQKLNKNVLQIQKPFLLNFNMIKSGLKNNQIGYLPEIGNHIVNFNTRQKMDLMLNELSIKHEINIYISLHRQEQSLNRADYYSRIYNSKYIKYRTEKYFEDYLNSIDILVGHKSTGLYQALLFKKPVIIMDIYNNKPWEEFITNSGGLAKYVDSLESLYNVYLYFNSLCNEDIEVLFKEFKRNMNINFNGISLDDLIIEKFNL